METGLTIQPITGVPTVKPGGDIASILIKAIRNNGQNITNQDIVCVASKIISVAEDRYLDLATVDVSLSADKLHRKIPNKDPRILQLILDQANGDEKNLRINGTWIGAKNYIGRVLTSAGIDKAGENTVLLLPKNPDDSARKIGEAIQLEFNAYSGVIITDSDGREGIAGATQLCIGLFGVPPLRQLSDSQETVCDMIAAAAGLVMGQRGNNIPAVIVRGYRYDFNVTAHLKDAY